MKAILLFLFNIYIAATIAADISLIFHVRRLRKVVDDYIELSRPELVLAYIMLSMWNIIPLFHLVFGLMWWVNAFYISDEDFIENYYRK